MTTHTENPCRRSLVTRHLQGHTLEILIGATTIWIYTSGSRVASGALW